MKSEYLYQLKSSLFFILIISITTMVLGQPTADFTFTPIVTPTTTPTPPRIYIPRSHKATSDELKNNNYYVVDAQPQTIVRNSTSELSPDKWIQKFGYVRSERVKHYQNQSGQWVCYYDNKQIEQKGNLDHGVQIGEWEYWYENGQLKKKGSYSKGLEQGEWAFWYPNGALMAKFTYNPTDVLSPLEMWHENGNKYFSGKFIRDKRNGILQISGDFSVWSKEENLIVKGHVNASSGTFSFDSLWPNGTTGVSCEIDAGHCDEGKLKVYFENRSEFFEHVRESVGWGSDEGCSDTLTVREKSFGSKSPDAEFMKKDEKGTSESYSNGPVTLYYPYWIQEFSFQEIEYLPQSLSPCLIGNLKNGKPDGHMIIVKPTLGINPVPVFCNANFKDGLADGNMNFNCLKSVFETVFKNGEREKDWMQNGEKSIPNHAGNGILWFIDQ